MSQPHYSDKLILQAQKIKLLICDVDGILSNGQVIIGNNNEELKAFNIKDGFGLKALQNVGIEVAIITGRNSKIVEKRCQELSIKHIFQGKLDKISSFESLCQKLSLSAEQVCHVGDDLPDLPLMKRAGLGVTVADGHWFVQQKADFITSNKGGFGAVREVSDLILSSQDKLEAMHESYWT